MKLLALGLDSFENEVFLWEIRSSVPRALLSAESIEGMKEQYEMERYNEFWLRVCAASPELENRPSEVKPR